MDEVVIKVYRRTVTGKQVKAIRREGKLPGVIYGHGVEPTPIEMDARETSRILSHMASSALVRLEMEGEQHLALIREKQRNVILGSLQHIDFQAVSEKEKIRVQVAIVLTGESPAVKDLSGILVSGKETLEVECLPQDLPDQILVDISGLKNFGDSILVRDVILPADVQTLTDGGEVIVVVTTPAAEEELAAPAEVTTIEPEVIERGKKEEEEF